MGLDQWLSKNGNVEISWRKCNQIHCYFDKLIGGIENLEDYSVSIHDLKELRELCEKVIVNHNEEISDELLPTMVGCFFGRQAYDEYYYQDVEWTKTELDNLILNHTDGDYYSYQASKPPFLLNPHNIQ